MTSKIKGKRYRPAYLFAGASGAENIYRTYTVDTTSTVPDQYVYGDVSVDQNNRFKRYQNVVEIEPYAALCLQEMGLAMGKGMKIRFPEDDTPSDEKSMLKLCNEMAQRVNLDQKFGESGRLLGQEGTNIPIISYYGDDDKDGLKGVKRIQFAPMAYTTLIPEGYRPGQYLLFDKDMAYGAMLGEVSKVVLNEQNGEGTWKVFDEDQFVLIRTAYESYESVDICKRNTIGLYGMSLLEPLLGTIRAKHNVLDSYVACIKRYGHMKLWFEYEALQNLIENQAIGMKDAQAVLDRTKAEIKKIKANEDIVTAGFDIKPIEHSEININVGPALEFMNKTIVDLLLGCDAGKSDSSNTYASSYIAEYRKILVLESMRRQVKRAYEQILARHLVANGYNEKDANKVRIYLDPVQEAEVTANDWLQFYLNGMVTDQQVFDGLGLNIKGDGEKYDPMSDPKAMLALETAKARGVTTGKPGAKPTGTSKTSPSTVLNRQKNNYEKNTE